MALVKRTLAPAHIWFADDIFGLRPQWVAEFAREVEDRNASIPFMIQSRVDLMTEQAVAGLARAGCVEVWLGVESGSQKILNAMDKGTQAEHIPVVRERLRQAGIKACFFIQFGYPGETFEDIMTTVKLVRDTLPDDIGVSVSYPLPGTKFHDMVKNQLGSKVHWEESNDLAMMFQGTYRTPFYRKLHTLIHEDLKLRQQLHTQDSPGAELFRALDRLNNGWCALGQLEAQSRSAAPTVLRKHYDQVEIPDLSKGWN
jgi:anaerobic magnesium-protoporphyrin IX monomethyl ester cyclase